MASPWCWQGQTTALTTVPNQFNASQLEIGSAATSAPISSSITSGDLGGLLAARNQVINPALNQLGQIATALSQTVNAQQAQGLDLSGNFGANDFLRGCAARHLLGEQLGFRHRERHRQRQRLGRIDRGQLHSVVPGRHAHADRYQHRRQRDARRAPALPPVPYTAAGVSIVLSGTPAAGDQFLIQPTADGGRRISTRC